MYLALLGERVLQRAQSKGRQFGARRREGRASDWEWSESIQESRITYVACVSWPIALSQRNRWLQRTRLSWPLKKQRLDRKEGKN